MWGEHKAAAIQALEQLDADDPCGLDVILFTDALIDADRQQGAIAARLLEPVVDILETWPEPTTPHDDQGPDPDLPEDLREAMATTDALRCVGSLLVLNALKLGPESAKGRAYAAAAVDLYAGRISGLGWVSGAEGDSER